MLIPSIIRTDFEKDLGFVKRNCQVKFVSRLDSMRVKAIFNSFLAPVIIPDVIFEEVYVLFLLSIAETRGDYRFYEIVGACFRNVILRSSRRHFFIYNTRAIAYIRMVVANARNIFPIGTF